MKRCTYQLQCYFFLTTKKAFPFFYFIHERVIKCSGFYCFTSELVKKKNGHGKQQPMKRLTCHRTNEPGGELSARNEGGSQQTGKHCLNQKSYFAVRQPKMDGGCLLRGLGTRRGRCVFLPLRNGPWARPVWHSPICHALSAILLYHLSHIISILTTANSLPSCLQVIT